MEDAPSSAEVADAVDGPVSLEAELTETEAAIGRAQVASADLTKTLRQLRASA